MTVSTKGVDPTRYVVFSGNVNVQATKYDPGDSFLIGLRDASGLVDAAGPSINQVADRFVT